MRKRPLDWVEFVAEGVVEDNVDDEDPDALASALRLYKTDNAAREDPVISTPRRKTASKAGIRKRHLADAGTHEIILVSSK